MIAYKSKVNFFTLLILLLIASMPLLDLIYPAKLDGVSRVIPILSKMLLLVSVIIYVIINQRKWWFKDSFGNIITIFIAIHLFYYLISSLNYSKDFYIISKTLIWYFGYFFFLDIGYRKILTNNQINLYFTVVIMLIFMLVFTGVSNEALFRSNREYGASNFAYFLLFVFPFIFMHKKVPYRLLIFIITSIGVAISFKRGTMLQYFIVIFYLVFLSDIRDIVGKKFSKYFKILIISVILVVVYYLIFSNLALYIEKFDDIINLNENNIDGIGSGRGMLYRLPIERWLNSNPINFILGYGFNSTPSFYPTTGLLSTKFYAHSDVVMLIHDYGFVGLLILVRFFNSIYKKIKRNIISVNKIPLTLIFLALLVKAIFSGFIIYEYSIYAFALLGLIIGRVEREKMITNEKTHEIKNI